MKCTSCKKEMDKKAVILKCPACMKQVYRCSRCRKLSVEYKCSCGFVGP